jgi:hypothetical protein
LALLVACSSKSEAPGTLHNLGVVTADSRRYTSGGQVYGQGSVAAAFVRDQADPFLGCERRQVGPCSAHYNCQPVHVDPPDLATTSDLGVSLYASAGSISVDGLPMQVILTQMTSGMFVGQYNVFQQYMPLFSGGEQLTVRATGSDVPAFTGVVTAPEEPTVRAPLPSQAPRSQDLTLSWTGGGAGEVRLSLSVPQMMANPGLDCSFSAAGGSAVIPSAALQTLPAGQGYFSLSVVSESAIWAGEWQVTLSATTGVLTTTGQPYEQGGVILK